MFIPENELGVLYLFSKYHEELGFERILKINCTGFPDIIAIRDGKEVGIELEFQLKDVFDHYIYSYEPTFNYIYNSKYQAWFINYKPPSSEYMGRAYLKNLPDKHRLFLSNIKNLIKEDKLQTITSPDEYLFKIIHDPHRELKKSPHGKRLVYKTLKPFCDVVICWEKAGYKLRDKIEVIELKNRKIQTMFKKSLTSD